MTQFQVGEIVIERTTERREVGAPIRHFMWVEIRQAWPHEGVYSGRPLRKVCYVEGYPEHARHLPVSSGDVGVLAQDISLAIHE